MVNNQKVCQNLFLAMVHPQRTISVPDSSYIIHAYISSSIKGQRTEALRKVRPVRKKMDSCMLGI